MAVGTAVTWQQFVIYGGEELISLVAVDDRVAGPDFYGLTDLASPHVVLSGYPLTLSILMGCSWSLTAVRGDFCFRWSFILAQGIEGLVVSPDCMVFENSGQFFGCTSDIWKAHAGAGLDPYVITCTYETCKISPLFQCICVDINRPLRLMAQMRQIVGNKE